MITWRLSVVLVGGIIMGNTLAHDLWLLFLAGGVIALFGGFLVINAAKDPW